MYKNDYVMRLIEQMTQVLAHTLRLTRSGAADDALQLTNDTLTDLLGIGSASVMDLKTETLVNQIKLQHDLIWSDVCAAAAALLVQEGDALAAADAEPSAYRRHLKALQILLLMDAQDEAVILPDFTPSVTALQTRLEAFALPSAVYAGLMRYHEAQSRYDKAEDVLFTWLEVDENTAVPHQTGIAFYHRLQAKSDTDLEAGGLPRPEVEAGLEELPAFAP